MSEPIVQSPDPDIDTLKCPKCGALWRAKGKYNYDDGGWHYYNAEDGIDHGCCPSGCKNFFAIPVKGRSIK